MEMPRLNAAERLFPFRPPFARVPKMRVFSALVTLLFLAGAASADLDINTTNLSQWLPKLPPYTNVTKREEQREMGYWLQYVHPGMSIAQVLALMGKPDWGVDRRGRLRWAINPKEGAVQYTGNGRNDYKGGERTVRIFFDNQARVKRIEDNGVVVARGRRLILPDPLRHGVWWRP